MRKIIFLLAILIVLAARVTFGSSSFQVWVSDPLVKIMQNTAQPANAPAYAHVAAARNEYESAQIVVTPTTNITSLTARVSAVSGPGTVKPGVSLNFVGYVHVEHGTPYTPPENLIATAPANFPDPLLESTSVSVTAPGNQPIWVTVHVPANATPGTYRTSIIVNGDGVSVSIPLVIDVLPVTVPSTRSLKIANWISYDTIVSGYNAPMWSEAFWTKVEAFAKLMADYRSNVILTRLNRSVVCHDDGKGKLTFDFTRFDRWVNTFKKAGALDIIEGGHLSGKKSKLGPDFYVWYPDIIDPKGENIKPQKIIATSDQAKSFYSQFLPALQQHLIEKGWIDKYIQHVGDEPGAINAESYRNVAAIVHQYAPRLKIIDAIATTNIAGAIDTWVLEPQNYTPNMAFFDKRRAAGEAVWYYTCLSPKGRYMNRFLDNPLIDVRLMPWANYKYDLPGYLQWGLNAWHGDSFTTIEVNYGSTTTAFDPPGDSHIVYKGKNGPLSSIRLEALRDGLEDFELLKLLEKSNPTRAKLICDSLITSFTSYTRDPAAFRAARAQLISSLMENTTGNDNRNW